MQCIKLWGILKQRARIMSFSYDTLFAFTSSSLTEYSMALTPNEASLMPSNWPGYALTLHGYDAFLIVLSLFLTQFNTDNDVVVNSWIHLNTLTLDTIAYGYAPAKSSNSSSTSTMAVVFPGTYNVYSFANVSVISSTYPSIICVWRVEALITPIIRACPVRTPCILNAPSVQTLTFTYQTPDTAPLIGNCNQCCGS